MPAVISEAQLTHLNRLNSLPQTRANGFQKGQVAWNAGTKIMLNRKCEYCEKPFQIAQSALSRIAHRSGRFCSLACFYNAKKRFGRREQIRKLYEQGKTIKEIGIELGILPSTISGYLYRMEITKHFRGGDAIFSTAHRKKVKTLLQEQGIVQCELCNYDRTVDIAHILERKRGGEYLLNNCLVLCPNCHHLFDHNMLTDVEKNKLRQITRLNGNLQRRLE